MISYLVVLLVGFIHFGDVTALVVETCIFALIYLTCAPIVRAINSYDIEMLTVALEGLGLFKMVLHPILSYERFILRLFGMSA